MLDLLLIAMLALCVLANAMRRKLGPRSNRRLRSIALGACFVQLAVEGPRLELVPAYVVAAVFALSLLIDLARNGFASAATRPSGSRIATFGRWLAVGGATVSLLLALTLCVALQSLDYPAPTGPYAIGTGEFRLTDRSRLELFTESGDDRREILVRVSYPAVDGDHPRDTIPGIAALIVGALWPNPITASWGAIPTHAKRGAPVATAQQRYPVLIFSHAMGGYPEQNTVLIEHLASHGYVVMAVNHAFLSADFELTDGSRIGIEVLLRPNPFPNSEQQELEEQAVRAKLGDGQPLSTAERTALIRQLAAINPRSNERWTERHRVFSDDQRFLLDSLSALPADSLLGGRLDLDRVGVFGMSSGGTASHMTCAVDRRCRAGLNLDGFQPLLLDLPPLQAPFMHMSSGDGLSYAIAHERSQAASYLVRVEGTAHLSFTDDVLTLHRLKRLGSFGSEVLGTIDAERMVRLVNDYALAFFNESLLGRPDPLLNGSTQRYEEVRFLSN
jgi:predicted dienelactone hydrolase